MVARIIVIVLVIIGAISVIGLIDGSNELMQNSIIKYTKDKIFDKGGQLTQVNVTVQTNTTNGTS